jgi:hypothetical protein
MLDVRDEKGPDLGNNQSLWRVAVPWAVYEYSEKLAAANAIPLIGKRADAIAAATICSS